MAELKNDQENSTPQASTLTACFPSQNGTQSRAFTLRQTAKHLFFLDKIQHPACCIPAKGMFRQLTINTRLGVNCVHRNCSGFFPIPG
jgi:hypothetical protein